MQIAQALVVLSGFALQLWQAILQALHPSLIWSCRHWSACASLQIWNNLSSQYCFHHHKAERSYNKTNVHSWSRCFSDLAYRLQKCTDYKSHALRWNRLDHFCICHSLASAQIYQITQASRELLMHGLWAVWWDAYLLWVLYLMPTILLRKSGILW